MVKEFTWSERKLGLIPSHFTFSGWLYVEVLPTSLPQRSKLIIIQIFSCSMHSLNLRAHFFGEGHVLVRSEVSRLV